MNLNKLIALLLIFCLACTLCSAQKKSKADLYLVFKKETTDVMSKQQRKNSSAVVRNGKTISTAYDYDTYTFVDKKYSRHFKVATINKNKFSIKTAAFVIKNGTTFEQLKDNEKIYFDSTDSKRFPYRKVFVVEELDKNRYKVIQVNTYMGSDY